MLIAERQSRLKDLLARKGMSDLDSLSSELQVSQSTIRRDVEQLEKVGLVRRTHGGVIWVGEDDRSGPGPNGALYNQNLLLVSAERKMMEQAQQTVLLVDSGKFGQQALARLCGLGDIDVVVSDAGLTPGQRDQVRDAGVQLIIAESDQA